MSNKVAKQSEDDGIEYHYALNHSSNVLLKKIYLGGNQAILIHSWVPENYIDKRSTSNVLRPTRKSVSLTYYDAYGLVQQLQRILPKNKASVLQPAPYFGSFTYPANSVVLFPDGTKEIIISDEGESSAGENESEKKPATGGSEKRAE